MSSLPDIEHLEAERRRRSPNSFGVRAMRLAWSIVQATLYRYSFPTWNGWRANLLRLFGASVGSRCTLRPSSRIYYPWLFAIGDLSGLGDEAEIYDLGPIRLGRRVTVSQQAYLCAGTHDYTRLDLPLVTKPIIVEDDAWICARAFIHPGVTIGEGSIAGAGAVVTRDVPPWTIVAGNPAAVVGARTLLPPSVNQPDPKRPVPESQSEGSS